MSLLNSTGFSVVSLASAGHQDAEGPRGQEARGDAGRSARPAVPRARRSPTSSTCRRSRCVQVDPAAKVVSVLEKRVDALLGGADDQYFLIKYKGEQPAALRYADHGANIVGMTILTQEATDQEQGRPGAPLRQGDGASSWDETKKNPEAAVDATMKVKPDLNRALAARPAHGRHRAARFGELEGPHRLGRAEGLGPDPRAAQAVSRRCRPTSPGPRSTPTNSCRSEWTRARADARVPDAQAARVGGAPLHRDQRRQPDLPPRRTRRRTRSIAST